MAKKWEKKLPSMQPNFNEFYTLYESCELIFRDLIPIINEQTKPKNDQLTVCCPCDSEKSNIVKWLQTNTDWKITYFDGKNRSSGSPSTRIRRMIFPSSCSLPCRQ